MIGVAAASPDRKAVMLAGLAGLIAGAMSMAAGEYVSVSSQADSEKADLARETRELAQVPQAERQELAAIYEARGLDAAPAGEVADQLMAKDGLRAHARDELGIFEMTAARPVQAAFASAVTFALGAAALPFVAALLSPQALAVPVVACASLAALGLLGALGARAGGARASTAVRRVLLWGALAMAATAGIGRLFGAVV